MATNPGLTGATTGQQNAPVGGAVTLQGVMTPAPEKKKQEKNRKCAGWMPWCLVTFGVLVVAAIVIAIVAAGGKKEALGDNGPRKSLQDIPMACFERDTPLATATGYITFPFANERPSSGCQISSNVSETIIAELAENGVTLPASQAFISFPLDQETMMPADSTEFWILTVPGDDRSAIASGLSAVLTDSTVQTALTEQTGVTLAFAGSAPSILSGEFGIAFPDQDDTMGGGGGPGGGAPCPDDISNEDRTALVTGTCSDISIDNYPFGVVDTNRWARWYRGATAGAVPPLHIGKWTYIVGWDYKVPRLTRSDDAQSWVWGMMDEYVRATSRPYNGFRLGTVAGKIAGAATESGHDIGVLGNNYNGQVQLYALKYDSTLDDHRLEWDTPVKVAEGITDASLFQFAGDSRLLFVCNGRMYVFKAGANDELEELADLDATNAKNFVAHDGTIYFSITDDTSNSLARLDESGGSYSVNKLEVDLLPQRSFASKLWGQDSNADLGSYTASAGLQVEKVLTPAGGAIASTTALTECGNRMWVQWDDADGDTVGYAGQAARVGMMWVESDGTLGSDVGGRTPWLGKSPARMGCLGDTVFMLSNAYSDNPVLRFDATSSAPVVESANGDGGGWTTWSAEGLSETVAPGVGLNHAGSKEVMLVYGETPADSVKLDKETEAMTFFEFSSSDGPNVTNLEVPRPSSADGQDAAPIDMCALGGKKLVFSIRDEGSSGNGWFSVRELASNGLDSTIIMTVGIEYTMDGELRNVVCTQDTAYFRLNVVGSNVGTELYSWSIGDTSPTLAADVLPGSSGSVPHHLTLMDSGKLAFSTKSSADSGGPRTYVFDPADDSLTLVTPAAADVATDVALREITPIGDRLFGFVPHSDNNNVCRYYMWSPGATELTLVDVLPGDNGDMSCPSIYEGRKWSAYVNNYLLVAYSGMAGSALLQVDTNALTATDLTPESYGGFKNLQVVGNEIFFTATICAKQAIAKVDTTAASPVVEEVVRFPDETSSVEDLFVASSTEMYTCSVLTNDYAGSNNIVRIDSDGHQVQLGGSTETCERHFFCRQFGQGVNLDGSYYAKFDTGAFGVEYVRLNNNS